MTSIFLQHLDQLQGRCLGPRSVSSSYSVKFVSLLGKSLSCDLIYANPSKRFIMFKVFQKLLEIRVVEPVPTQEGDCGICSTFFTILKKENDW